MSTDVSEVRPASIIALMIETARTSETSVDIQLRTRQYIPEDSELHTRRRENLKSYSNLFIRIYSGGGGVKFTKYFKKGANYKSLGNSGLDPSLNLGHQPACCSSRR
jgi:hypothetical protein